MLAQVRCQNHVTIFFGGSLGCFCNSTACNFFSLKMLTASLVLEFGREKRDFRHEIH